MNGRNSNNKMQKEFYSSPFANSENSEFKMNGRRAKHPSKAKTKRLKIKISKLKYIFIQSIPFADIIDALKHETFGTKLLVV